PRPAPSTTASSDCSHSAVSSGSTSGSWLGSPSLMTLKRSSLPVVTPPSLSLLSSSHPPATRPLGDARPPSGTQTDPLEGGGRSSPAADDQFVCGTVRGYDDARGHHSAG